MNPFDRMRHQRGVTLMELLIVMVVVSILSSLAVPSYQRYVTRAQRSAAKSDLLATSAALERCFARLNAYDHVDCDAAGALPRTVAEGRYQIRANALTAGAFALWAVPLGAQTRDTDCQTLTLDNRNQRGVTGGATQTGPQCWAR
jgi:type IV pilus assembly protein PilE